MIDIQKESAENATIRVNNFLEDLKSIKKIPKENKLSEIKLRLKFLMLDFAKDRCTKQTIACKEELRRHGCLNEADLLSRNIKNVITDDLPF